MACRWSFTPHDRGLVSQISRELRCSPLLARVLAARGHHDRLETKSFLTAPLNDLHDPSRLPGVEEAADRIVSGLRGGRRITVYGDYDVDGVTGTSILWHCLKLAGANVDYYIPCRMSEGYGLNPGAIRQLHEEDAARLVVTVDCGIGSLEEAALARELGLELIVTDHHTLSEQLPAAACVVHPRRPGGDYPFPDLCGAGVAFKLAWAVCQRLGDGKRASPAMREFLKSAVGLAAMGTVADVVPLVGENRIFVKHGLRALHEMRMVGLGMLIKVAGLDSKPHLTAEDIGFGLAPRINAAGRLGQARLAVELLTTQDRPRAAQLADYIDQLNRNRQTVERRTFREAREMVEQSDELRGAAGLVLAHPDWHCGVIGIVAGRIADRFTRPTFLIAMNDEQQLGQGSGRSVAEFDLHAAVQACAEHLETFGGHKAAVGLRIRNERVEAFRESFAGYASTRLQETSGRPTIRVDAEVQFTDLTRNAVRELEVLGPYGCEHQRPRFVATRVHLAEEPRKMGGGDRHLSVKLRQANRVLRGVAFGKGEWADELAASKGALDICFAPSINSYKGYENVELELIDWQNGTDNRNSGT
jgi:single-stranded-DNA-specific exonuclease